MIMLIRRIYSLRSAFTHGKEVPSVATTVSYLQSYMQSLDLSRKYSTEEMIKGKMPMWREEPAVAQKEAIVHPWPKPPPGKVALSVDGAFLQSDGSAAAGMVLRRHDGSAIISAYRCIFNCNEALEAELHALM